MPRRSPVKVLMQDGKWQLPLGESIPDLRDPPPDPVTFKEKLALNGTLPPARIKEAMGQPGNGDSPARQTQRKYAIQGICERCGNNGPVATKRMCAGCRDRANKITRSLKKRLAMHGLCVDCGRRDTGNTLKCEECRARYNKRHH